jgi:hypothetical protein
MLDEEVEELSVEMVLPYLLAQREPCPLTEEWRVIPEFPDYQINRCGEVLNQRGWMLTPQKTRKYKPNHSRLAKWIQLTRKRKCYARSLDILVQSAFPEDYR